MWFRNARDGANTPRALQGWIGPRDMLDMLESDVAAANKKLSDFSYDPLRDADGLGLRPYQIEAIANTEAAVVKGDRTALLEMAAGTGKTRIVPGMIHRFLKSGRFKRILLLTGHAVDGQAPDVFRNVNVENHMTLEQLYNARPNQKIHVSTVPALFERIFIDSGGVMPSVTEYDLIIADEACQGCNPDEYREVLDYFDAVNIVLTADSAQHAAEAFGRPVFTYPHSRAVAEGYLAE